MSIKIIKPGIMCSIQDGGRKGYRSMGIGPGGAMDHFAMKVSNMLVGNHENTAVIEIGFPAPEILFQQDALISITGADLSAAIDNKALLLWRPVWVTKGGVLKFKKPVHGARAYLAVRGGWKAEKWLGSYSTHLQVNAGGHLGRTLQKNDIIAFNESKQPSAKNKTEGWYISPYETGKIYSPENIIRCTKGVEWDLLEGSSKQRCGEDEFEISNESDRMGYRLKNRVLSLMKPTEIISSAVDHGTVQLLPDGNLIVLMADHQTTGGYPRIASVIKADLPKLAQARAGQKISFCFISLEEAEDALISMEQALTRIRAGCRLHSEKYFHVDRH